MPKKYAQQRTRDGAFYYYRDWHEHQNREHRMALHFNSQGLTNKSASRRIKVQTLVLVKDLRNNLAHGSISFEQCGDGVTAVDLRDLAAKTVDYLREIIAAYQAFIDSYEFLKPASRPTTGGGS